VNHESARVLVDEAASGEEINEAEAQKAHDAAVSLLKQAKTQVELERAQSIVDRSIVRLDVAKLKRRHPRQ
jgi:F0F1-type ATP synthase epsilon subunit